MPRKEYVASVRRIVVKIGSSSLTREGKISIEKMARFVEQVSDLCSKGYEIVIVSSGAITAGAGLLGRNMEHLAIPEKQALAAVGQSRLMEEYRRLFGVRNLEVGQILMTEDDVKNRRRFLNLRNTINTLLKMNIVPVVNENDSVVVKEIKLGDNDTLSVHVANMVEAQLLVLLSDVDGLYRDLKDPAPIDTVNYISDEVRNLAGGTGSKYGSGGMHTKLNAADIMIRSGEMMVIANAKEESVLKRIIEGERVGTLFVHADDINLPGKKRWIEFNMKAKGAVHIDDGAVKALVNDKKSLLAIGIAGVEGPFKVGDAITIVNNGKVIAKGISNYSSERVDTIKGFSSSRIFEIYGQEYYEEVVHRDNMIVY